MLLLLCLYVIGLYVCLYVLRCNVLCALALCKKAYRACLCVVYVCVYAYSFVKSAYTEYKNTHADILEFTEFKNVEDLLKSARNLRGCK